MFAMVLQATPNDSLSGSFVVPTLLCLLIITALIGLVAVIRKYMFSGSSDNGEPLAGLNLSSMRQLVRDGRMSPEEYEIAKRHLVAAAARDSDKAAADAKVSVEHKLPYDPPGRREDRDREQD